MRGETRMVSKRTEERLDLGVRSYEPVTDHPYSPQGLVTNSPDQARALLNGNPQVAYALFQVSKELLKLR